MTINRTQAISWIFRLVAALIMLQTLFFKFTAAPESVYLFSKLGMEPWGRIGVGVLELIASVLLLVNRTLVLGALMGVGLMSGALFFHLTQLGVVVQNDAGQLFIYALVVFISCLILCVMHGQQILSLLPFRKLNV